MALVCLPGPTRIELGQRRATGLQPRMPPNTIIGIAIEVVPLGPPAPSVLGTRSPKPGGKDICVGCCLIPHPRQVDAA
jgi:hypothetical protein